MIAGKRHTVRVKHHSAPSCPSRGQYGHIRGRTSRPSVQQTFPQHLLTPLPLTVLPRTPNTVHSMATALGIAADFTGILSFLLDFFPDPQTNANKFRFKLADDGYHGPDGQVITNAGGNKPDVRIWSPVGSLGDHKPYRSPNQTIGWEIPGHLCRRSPYMFRRRHCLRLPGRQC